MYVNTAERSTQCLMITQVCETHTHHLAADLPFPGLENPDVPEDDDTPEPSSTLPDAPQDDEVSDDLRGEHVHTLQAENKECKLPPSYLWM